MTCGDAAVELEDAIGGVVGGGGVAAAPLVDPLRECVVVCAYTERTSPNSPPSTYRQCGTMPPPSSAR